MHDDSITSRARRLRRDSTDAERLLWNRLRGRRLGGYKFRRQAPICGYIVDFACFDKRLIVEIDGGHHGFESNLGNDEVRRARIESEGFMVLRFWNSDVYADIDGVLESVLRQLESG